MSIVGLAGESQTRPQSPSLVRKSLIISMKIMMTILLLMLTMAFIMRGGHDNESEIGTSTGVHHEERERNWQRRR